jgi:uracil-DNA glycosylase
MTTEPYFNDFQELEQDLTACRKCPRLVAWREEVARTRRRAYHDQEYWGKPVPGFGDPQARVLVVGLAPGAHGSNRTGRMFTGDSSGDFLYPALHRAGFANQPIAGHRLDDLQLKDIFITAVARCAPPANRPTPAEITNCRPYLLAEMHLLSRLEGIVALGSIAFEQVLLVYRQQGLANSRFKFEHGGFSSLGENQPWLLASYHPSRQNTQTGRLTRAMFDDIWQNVSLLLAEK